MLTFLGGLSAGGGGGGAITDFYGSFGRFQVKIDIAFLAFFKILDKDEDNSSLGYHCEVKFQGDKIWHVFNMRVSSKDAEIINKCAKMRVKNNQ